MRGIAINKVSRAATRLFGELLPLLVAVLAIGLLLVDMFDFISVPDDAHAEILLFVASIVLLAYFAAHRQSEASTKALVRLNTSTSVLFDRVNAQLDGVRQVPAAEIRGALEANITDASAFYFRGGSGRWLRHYSLPQLSLVRSRQIELGVQLLDPRDEFLCRAYAHYRKVARNGVDVRDGEDDPRLIQRDILGSIYLAAYYSATARLKAEVVLLRTFSSLRYDVTDRGLVISVAGKAEPALVASAGTWFHEAVVDEMRQGKHGNGVLVLPSDLKLFPSLDSVTGETVAEALGRVRVKESPVDERPLLAGFAGSDVDWIKLAAEHVRE